MQQRLDVHKTNQDGTKAEPAGTLGDHVVLCVVVLLGSESDTFFEHTGAYLNFCQRRRWRHLYVGDGSGSPKGGFREYVVMWRNKIT